jgi:hypothetical protein
VLTSLGELRTYVQGLCDASPEKAAQIIAAASMKAIVTTPGHKPVIAAMILIPRTRVALGVGRRSYPPLITRANAVQAAIAANPALFPAPNPTPAVLLVQIQTLEAAQQRTTAKVPGASADRNAAADIVLTSLGELRTYVQGLCNASPEKAAQIVAAASMKAIVSTPAHKPVIAAMLGVASGSVLSPREQARARMQNPRDVHLQLGVVARRPEHLDRRPRDPGPGDHDRRPRAARHRELPRERHDEEGCRRLLSACDRSATEVDRCGLRGVTLHPPPDHDLACRIHAECRGEQYAAEVIPARPERLPARIELGQVPASDPRCAGRRHGGEAPRLRPALARGAGG